MDDVVVPRIRVGYFVPPSPHFAGIERVVHEIATGLTEAHGDELEVHVLYSSHYDDELLRDPPYTLHVLGVDRLRGLAAKLRSVVSTHEFDIFVCPQIEASVIAWTATRGLRLRHFVTHLHGNPRIEETEGTRRTRVAFALFRHVVSRRLSAVVAVSPSLQRYAAASIARHTTVLFAKNPVRALDPTTPVPPGEDDRFRFVNVGRLCRQKGQDVLLRALALARPDLPPVALTLVGSGTAELELRALSRDLGVDDIVDFPGSVPDPTVHLRSANCFVLASRWEGFGVVLVEALQLGLPLLAADCEFGPADVITDPRIGELVEAGSPEAMAEGLRSAVRRATDDDAGALRRGAAAAYTRERATRTHLDALRQVVGSGNPRMGRLADFAAPRQ